MNIYWDWYKFGLALSSLKNKGQNRSYLTYDRLIIASISDFITRLKYPPNINQAEG